MDLGNPEKLDVFFTGKEAESFSSPIPQNIYQLFLIFYFVGRFRLFGIQFRPFQLKKSVF